jgi:hypothetical protein
MFLLFFVVFVGFGVFMWLFERSVAFFEFFIRFERFSDVLEVLAWLEVV